MTDLLPEKWMKVMAMTTTALGVVASVALSRASFYTNQSQLFRALEADQWSYYQAKSIKQELFQTRIKSLQLEQLGLLTPDQEFLLNQTLDNYSKEITRYNQEKTEIKAQAEKIHRDNVISSRRSSEFSMSVVFAQIAIMLSAVGVLLKRRSLWIVGLIFGFISLFFIANGFLLFFTL